MYTYTWGMQNNQTDSSSTLGERNTLHGISWFPAWVKAVHPKVEWPCSCLEKSESHFHICWEHLMQTCTMSRWRSMLEAWCNSYKATGKSDEIFSPSVALQGGGLQEAKYNKKQKKVKKKVQGIWKSEIRRFVRFWGQWWIWATWVSIWSLILRSTGDWICMNLDEPTMFCFVLFKRFYEIRNAVLEI